jgi:hypothetical protein
MSSPHDYASLHTARTSLNQAPLQSVSNALYYFGHPKISEKFCLLSAKITKKYFVKITMGATINTSKFRLSLDKQESLVKLGILSIAAILCKWLFSKLSVF